ncbi:methyltransferase domain-containing protein [Dehalococcoidia bacterium]|nr:methyltransferase domain-containing protein [Dehalococcoidia bacterium]
MKLESLKQMRCPYCGADFNLGEVYQENEKELIDGYIKCECNEFPILEGILIIKPGFVNKYLVKLLRDGKTKEASEFSLESLNESTYKVRRLLRSKGICGRALGEVLSGIVKIKAKRRYKRYSDERLPLYSLLGMGDSDIYLKNRFSAETLWSLYPFIPILKESRERILDLSCGAGHASFVVSTCVKPHQLVCADHSFAHLYLAKKYFVKDATFICLDANYPLPFKDGTFSSILMLDAFHYIDARASLAREMERTLSPYGLLLLLHLHNSLDYNLAAGKPLSPSGWLNLFQQLPVKALPEKNIVEDFLMRGRLDLTKQYTEDELNFSNAISIVGTRKKSLLQTYQDVWRDFLGNKSNLIINPIYSIEHKPDKIILRRKFPSESFRNEYRLTEKYLPEEYAINGELAEAINGRTLNITCTEFSKKDFAHIEYLMRKFIVINVPEDYIAKQGDN